MFRIFILLIVIFFCQQRIVWAYMDPGSGGYLISSVLVTIGNFLAFCSALAIYFFRNIVGKRINILRRKYIFYFIPAVLLVLSGIGFLIYRVIYNPTTKLDSSLSGAYVIDAARVDPGFYLYHGELMDEFGHVVKKWSGKFLGTIDKNGDYYAEKNVRAKTWGRYTWDDKIIWEKNFQINHELLLTPKGTIITFVQEAHQYNGRNVKFDVILEFDKNGRQLQRFSFWDHLKYFQKFHRKLQLDMPFYIPIFATWHKKLDYYHLNSFQLLPKTSLGQKDQRFREGNWLISFRHGSMIFILDQDTHEIVWKCIAHDIPDGLEGQHGPTMLADGRILIFDNGCFRGWSRVLELDPVTMKIVWEYRAKGFFTKTQGYAQRLGNGNTFVTESERGRVFEITREGEIVWEYYYPKHQNKKGMPEEKGMWRSPYNIYRMTHYSPEFITPLLKT